MTTLLVPDNTVLVRFARFERMDLLARLVGDNGRWCGTVAGECERSARQPGLDGMLRARSIFGEPLRLMTGQEIVDTEAIRMSLAVPGDDRWRHLGEAETISIISNRSLVAVFVTDDRMAARRAADYGIRSYTTWDLLKLAVRVGLSTPTEAYGYVLRIGGHHERLPHLASFDTWTDWCASSRP